MEGWLCDIFVPYFLPVSSHTHLLSVFLLVLLREASDLWSQLRVEKLYKSQLFSARCAYIDFFEAALVGVDEVLTTRPARFGLRSVLVAWHFAGFNVSHSSGPVCGFFDGSGREANSSQE